MGSLQATALVSATNSCYCDIVFSAIFIRFFTLDTFMVCHVDYNRSRVKRCVIRIQSLSIIVISLLIVIR